MVRVLCVILAMAAFLGQAVAQKKPEAAGKGKKPAKEMPPPEAAPPLDPELKRELDALEKEVGAPIRCVQGKNFDVAGPIPTSQLELMMEVADRAYRVFEELTADAGGVAGERVTGASPLPAGKTPACRAKKRVSV